MPIDLISGDGGNSYIPSTVIQGTLVFAINAHNAKFNAIATKDQKSQAFQQAVADNGASGRDLNEKMETWQSIRDLAVNEVTAELDDPAFNGTPSTDLTIGTAADCGNAKDKLALLNAARTADAASLTAANDANAELVTALGAVNAADLLLDATVQAVLGGPNVSGTMAGDLDEKTSPPNWDNAFALGLTDLDNFEV